MIPVGEVRTLRDEWQLTEEVIEKDYVLGWLLAGIAAQPELEGWIFKGGTALRKCYYETYRFSEDLDFTIVDGGPEEPDDLLPVFERVGAWVYEACGLELVVDESSFRRRKNKRDKPTTQGQIAYRGPRNPPGLPKVKLDLTSDELLVRGPERQLINHPYSDAPDGGLGPIRCYSIAELLAEKLRALAERCRPRDLYDVVNLHRHADLAGRFAEVAEALDEKCAYVGIATPDAEAIHASPHRDELEQEWENMLGHQLPHLPPIGEFLTALDDVFAWLAGRVPVATLPRAEFERDALDPGWAPPRMMTTWRQRAPLELIRFAGANRLKVEVDYVPKEGRIGPRLVTPLSLRRSRAGNLLLYLINDYGALRSYRVDGIRGVRVTNEPFAAPYLVEF